MRVIITRICALTARSLPSSILRRCSTPFARSNVWLTHPITSSPAMTHWSCGSTLPLHPHCRISSCASTSSPRSDGQWRVRGEIMAKLRADMLLVGSVNLHTVEEVFTTCGKLMGDHVPALPDGELGERSMWIYFLAAHTYHGHPAITTIGEIIPVKAFPPSGAGPQNPEAVTHFRLKEGVKTVHFDELGYAREAFQSYEVFRQRRGAGDIANGIRFQVALPFPQDATFLFYREPTEAAIVAAAYEEALGREIEQIFARVP